MSAIEFSPDALTRLVLWGDPQISRLYPGRERNLAAACRTLAALDAPADALVILGDVTEFGRQSEYAAVRRQLTAAAENAARIFCVPGNHDIRLRPFAAQRRIFSRFLRETPNGVPFPDDRYWFSCRLPGCRLLFLGADKTCFEGTFLSRAQLGWLASELDAAAEAGETPLVFNHQPLLHTNGLPLTWGGRGDWRGSVGDQNDALRAVFKKHGGGLYITGHLHYGIGRYNLEHSGSLHMLSVPSLGCANHGPNPDPGQGYLLELCPGRIVGTAVQFNTGEPLDPAVPNARFEIPTK